MHLEEKLTYLIQTIPVEYTYFSLLGNSAKLTF